MAIKISSILIFTLMLGACGNKKQITGATEAKDALATFRIADGFKIEMIASEPLVSSPVDMEIDEYGRMYVVEMHGYPLDKSGSGDVILLADEDGDGKMDKRTVFKEGLLLPSSIMRWKKGVLITDAPNLLYLEDTDGDGKANITDTILSGFALTNPQHNVNSPVYGLDNWIYLAHQESVETREYKKEFGDEGAEIIFYNKPNTPTLPKNADGRSIRFRPDQKLIELASASCQFGHTFDEWGHRFGCNNSNQGYQEVIANRYFQRNPDMIISEATQDMSDHLNAAEVFPSTIHPDRQLLTDVGVMTSACGLTAYLGDAFPAPYNRNVTFVAEPVSNLVHVDVLKDNGASFTASRILEQKEFLSSTDAWSRPVNMYVGPDGALYVLDYYRKVIESPEWMSEDAIKAGDLYDGIDKGRIYRITPTNAKPAEWTKGLKLGDATNEELVNTLSHPNNWWRLNAQRLLVDRGDKEIAPALIAMLNNNSPMGRLHALWTLQGLGELKSQQIEKALKDSIAGIRENAIQLAELNLTIYPELATTLLSLQNDKDAKVRFQLLLTLGFINTPQATAVRNKILFSDINDKWVQIAALSVSSSQTTPLLKTVLNNYREEIPAYASLAERLATMTGIGGSEMDIHWFIQEALKKPVNQSTKSSAVINGLAKGLKARKKELHISQQDQQLLVKTFFDYPSSGFTESVLHLLKVNGIEDSTLMNESIQKATAIIRDTIAGKSKRAEAIRFLTLDDPAPFANDLEKLLSTKEEIPVQLAALHTLSEIKGNAVSEYLVQHWSILSPSVHDAAIATFLNDSARVALLIDALEKDKIKPEEVGFSNSVQLMMNTNDNLRNRARNMFTKNEREAKKVNKEYQESLELNGNAENGKTVFVNNCAICHQVRGKTGIAIGPDLGTIHNWTKEDIMANVLNPNLSISSGFGLWEVRLNNGDLVQGIIASETSAAITLRNSGKPDKTINRQDIQSLKSVTLSAMPSGLEKKINKQQMADLLTYLRQN